VWVVGPEGLLGADTLSDICHLGSRGREKHKLLDFVITSATFVHDSFVSAFSVLAQSFTLRENNLLAVPSTAQCLMTEEHLFY